MRYHFGSMIATVCAAVNLYKIRQQVLKYAIYFTKSKNRLVLIPVA